MKARIKYVTIGSIAEELGIEKGDYLTHINGKPILDIMDYLYHRDDDYLTMTFQKCAGDVWQLDIDKDYDEDIGLIFENPIIDCAQHCTNNCIFCFIDQLPRGMRESLYFKDDDSRLSFMMGNFVTLTNLSDEVFQRIIDYRISPINISVHTVDADLRVKMLGNRFAANIKERLSALAEAAISMNGQVVLLPGVNDGAALDQTIEFLSRLYPAMQSMAVVPVGLTDFRQHLPQIEPVNQLCAQKTIAQIDRWQRRLLERLGSRFVYAADEFYLRANVALPAADDYDDYVHIENGVGLIRQFEDAALSAVDALPDEASFESCIVVTSVDAAAMMQRIYQKLTAKFGKITLDIKPVVNNFFGHSITVSGLLTGVDIIDQLAAETKGRTVLLPANILNSDQVLLDDYTLPELAAALQADIKVVPVDGAAFIDELIAAI